MGERNPGVNIAPLLVPALAAESEAPCSLASRLAIASPSPSPPRRRSGPCSACVNGSNNLSANCSSNPTPESRTVTTACPAFCANDSSTVPPAGVNLMAFAKRLSRICRSRTRSALTKQTSPANCAITFNPACCVRVCCSFRTSARSSERATRSSRTDTFPKAVRAASCRSPASESWQWFGDPDLHQPSVLGSAFA